MIRKKTILIIAFASIFILSVYMMFLGNFPKVVYEKQLDTTDLEKVSVPSADNNQIAQADKNLESDFFIDYKLERDRLRGQEADYLRELINNPNAGAESKQKAQQDLIALSQKVEKEMIVENLIKAKGFEDAVIFFSDEFMNIVVRTAGLLPKDIAQITDVVTKTTGIAVDKITIIERK